MSGEIRINAGLSADEIIPRDSLLIVLDGIKEKTPANWYDIDGNGRLVVVEPPRDCLSWIWEVLVRFFTGKFSLIETRIDWITDQVEAYVTGERDPALLGDFCDRTSNAVNRLYETAAKLHAKQRISEEIFQKIQAHPTTAGLVLTQEDPARIEEVQGRLFHPYAFLAHFTVENRLANTQVRFAFNEDEPSAPLERNLQAGDGPVEFFIRSKGNMRHLNAMVLREQTFNIDGEYLITLDPKGVQIAKGENGHHSDERIVRLKNNSPVQMFAQFPQPGKRILVLQANESYRNESTEVEEINTGDENGSIRLAPGESYTSSGCERLAFKPSVDFVIPPYGDIECLMKGANNVNFVAGYQTETLPVNFGCKMGSFAFVVDEEGRLTKRVVPHVFVKQNDPTDDVIPAQTRPDEPTFMAVSNDTEHDVWAAVQVKDTNVVEHVFIKRGGQEMISYEKMLARVARGSDSESRKFVKKGIPVTVTMTEVDVPN